MFGVVLVGGFSNGSRKADYKADHKEKADGSYAIGFPGH